MNSAKTNPKKGPQQRPAAKLSPTPPAPRGVFVSAMDLAARFQRFAWDVAGVSLLAFSVMTLLAIWVPELTGGALLSWWRALLGRWLGWGSVLMVIAGTIVGLLMLRKQSHSPKPVPGSPAPLAGPETSAGFQPPAHWFNFFVLEFGAFTWLAFLAALGGTSLQRAEQGLDGGRIGWGLAELLRLLLASIDLTSQTWQIMIFGALLTGCMILGLGLTAPLARLFQKISKAAHPHSTLQTEPVISVSPAEETDSESSSQKKRPVLPVESFKHKR